MSVKLVDITLDTVCEHGVCGYKNIKNKGLQRKVDWLKAALFLLEFLG